MSPHSILSIEQRSPRLALQCSQPSLCLKARMTDPDPCTDSMAGAGLPRYRASSCVVSAARDRAFRGERDNPVERAVAPLDHWRRASTGHRSKRRPLWRRRTVRCDEGSTAAFTHGSGRHRAGRLPSTGKRAMALSRCHSVRWAGYDGPTFTTLHHVRFLPIVVRHPL